MATVSMAEVVAQEEQVVAQAEVPKEHPAEAEEVAGAGPDGQAETDDSDSDSPPAEPDAAAEDGTLPSVGSALHASGECKRCCFFHKGRCANGHACKFCHLPHERPRM
eukprot:CAMPEP_0170297018 /NCGR_PEP_ID=MMETSP0116_2-20130129/48666_1 /TAXON_ID=400756 /ORGANISM="Durinskia baltica, Strain CSIRO CS-38" /LENGTH=107 /DNA_ID=CAMNT_0010548635 /DNA_START=84 /DNA_END=404 /DNA_ORIENTATION=+